MRNKTMFVWLALALALLALVSPAAAGASALDGYEYYQKIEYAACDQEVYQQDIVVHRTTGTAYEETVGDLKVWHVYVGDRCKSDYGDVRFTDASGNALAYYLWPDYDSSSARFCVRLEGADAAGELLVWYGNPGATTTSDGDATYILYDQFDEAALNSTKWSTRSGATATLASGYCTLGGIDGVRLTSKDPLPDDCIVEVALNPLSSMWVGVVVRDQNYLPYEYSKGYMFSYYTPSAPFDSSRLYYTDGSNYIQLDTAPKVSANTRIDRVITVAGDDFRDDNGLSATHSTWSSGRLSFVGGPKNQAVLVYSVVVRAYSATPPAAITFSGERETASPPFTAFTATPITGRAPLTVQFTDLSGGLTTSWHWTSATGPPVMTRTRPIPTPSPASTPSP